MNDLSILSTLSWRGPRFTLQDFYRLLKLRRAGVVWARLSSHVDEPLKNKLSSCSRWWEQGVREIETVSQSNLRLLTLADPEYPKEFLGLPYPPFLLSVRGDCPWTENVSLSVVGSRDCTAGTMEYFEHLLAETLRQYHLNVVSGGARGVDQRAHAVSLRSGAPTTILLPSGLLNVYPRHLQEWLGPVVERGGGILSPFAPSTPMRKHHFQWRNQMIAALAPVTFVVEAASKSGTMITARWALQMGRELGVLPAAPWNSKGAGSNRLLQEGAHMILQSQDLQGLMSSSAASFYERSRRQTRERRNLETT